ncbi:MAG: DUF2155 domain-containing protein [Pseudomonadota bacterium]
MIRFLTLGLLFVGQTALAQTPTSLGSGAVLRGLDKVSGQSSDITLTAGQAARFGRLTVVLRECRFPQDNQSGDAYASIEINEAGKDEAVFDGWMIASAPALSAVDHARYDVWVLRCTTS